MDRWNVSTELSLKCYERLRKEVERLRRTKRTGTFNFQLA